ncbi:3-carboxy-cis,cis-mucoante lactonizing enzyme [Dothidotthia symphoricarpi CBS 119687]|uniref:3-carboxy-cis,cis-mucoante lactonizing enzyme n=1 Tax=Dothidotthia symphoricarpi CBS 119687 TaxID=1392245 RepID=A0A6A6A472_9PLEO|nr:3-carboxy-cis,cis-mucoante lactonizing enzyme [Dothidotthia symphoricarpi CBS 119687]KAF2126689.1 3-carboxy-cis,cis-mucoante lactonizing enzyme [Dothidotthia symphoricarpi CBS 119687]
MWFYRISPLAFATLAFGESHYFFSGFFAGSTIVGVTFDDATSTLSLVNNITTQATSGSKWIAIDARKQNIYVATTGAFQSYAITANKSLEFSTEIALSSDCQNANYLTAASASNYTVFGTPYSTGCSTQAVSVDDSGALKMVTANLTYNSKAGVHGIDLSPDNAFVYSGDDMGNAVWVHSYDQETQTATEIQYLAAPSGANPRHLAVHPNGEWVYVIYEEANSLAIYKRDNFTGLLTDTNTTYSLLPSNITDLSSYWSDEAKFSIPSTNSSTTSPKYLITGTRSHSTSILGYTSAFALDPITGAITEQLFITPTTGSGGSANAVSPAPFSEEYYAITDSGSNFLEMWKIGDDGKSAAAVAHLGLNGAPANVVWTN